MIICLCVFVSVCICICLFVCICLCVFVCLFQNESLIFTVFEKGDYSRVIGFVQVYENGQNEGEETVFFNLKEASKGIGNDRNLLLQRVSCCKSQFKFQGLLTA